MGFNDIKVFLENFNYEMKELEKRFALDPNHNLFQCYIPMSQNLRKKAHAYILPLLRELEILNMRYGEKYKMKDIEFHIKHTSDHINFIKQLMKEVLALYDSQASYEEISKKWPSLFTNLNRRMPLINSRLILIEKIIKDEF